MTNNTENGAAVSRSSVFYAIVTVFTDVLP